MTIAENAINIPEGKSALSRALYIFKEFARKRELRFLSEASTDVSVFINNNAGTAFIGAVALGIAYGQ
jgi:predicted PurR-regulated permease PerM